MYDRYKTRYLQACFSGLHWHFPLGLFHSTFFRFIGLVSIFSAYLRCTIKKQEEKSQTELKEKGGKGKGGETRAGGDGALTWS